MSSLVVGTGRDLSLPEPFWQKLESKALELGFSEIGVAPVTPLDKESQYFEEWLANGFAADMDYMKRTKEVRKDPRLFFQNARYVLVGSVNYYRDQKEDARKGRVARYAYGRDYHKAIKKMLNELREYLQQEFFPESGAENYRLSLDAHPVLERAWAKRAKVGFIGKNSCLITKKAGSWVLLGLLFTDQEIPPKSAEKGLEFDKLSCGNCTRCSDICPTKAIVAPGVIDANKCISYLTIENKGPIPVEFRKAMGDRIFGCDICQEVCPFNKKREKEEFNHLSERPIAGNSLLISEILAIQSDKEFLEKFAGSPLMRAGRLGMLRNACVVAGNSKEKSLIALLQKIIAAEENEMVKEHATWALKELYQV